ncbi:MAG: MBL fold metallo-hydrolase [Bacteroidetes bacterium]|nr:MBL fold metallo-hydrolase [Bacteroidota bacterium]
MADYSLEQVGENTYFIPSPVNIGMYIQNDSVHLIDSGGDKDAGRKISRLLVDRGWSLEMICNTHSNADHIGGNNYLQKKYSCRIGASEKEKPFIEFPEFEPAFLWGGYPHAKIENKFLMAQPSVVTDILCSGSDLQPPGLSVVDLPGHFIQMIGYKTPDDIFFIADSLFPEHIIEKYHICYVYDVGKFLETINFLKSYKAALFIPSHGTKSDNIEQLADLNEKKVHEISQLICEICDNPKSPDEIIALVCAHYKLEMSAAQYVLMGSTVKSYIGYLQKQQRLSGIITDNLMKWITQ